MAANLLAEEVRVGITGAVYKAPAGTAKPADSTAVLAADYIGMGYVSEDGVTENHDDSTSQIVAWQGAVVVRSVRTDSTSTMAFQLIQTRGSVLEAFHPGSNMTEPTAGNFELEVKPPGADPAVWLFDVVDGDKHIRIWCGNSELTERGEVVYSNGGDPIGYSFTVTCYPDDDGNLMVKMSDDPAWGLDLEES